MYEQSLHSVIEPIKLNTIARLNKSKAWKYGYNKEHDVIVISRTGQIGEIYEIQNVKIALPKVNDLYKFESGTWGVLEYPKQLSSINIRLEKHGCCVPV
jgi:hypothetical protein